MKGKVEEEGEERRRGELVCSSVGALVVMMEIVKGKEGVAVNTARTVQVHGPTWTRQKEEANCKAHQEEAPNSSFWLI